MTDGREALERLAGRVPRQDRGGENRRARGIDRRHPQCLPTIVELNEAIVGRPARGRHDLRGESDGLTGDGGAG